MKLTKHSLCDDCCYYTPSRCCDGPSPNEEIFQELAIDKLTEEKFQEILEDIINNTMAKDLLTIPGVSEIMSMYYEEQIHEEWINRCWNEKY